jgi:protocatechuate 3,4-dioxygenase beta subunit
MPGPRAVAFGLLGIALAAVATWFLLLGGGGTDVPPTSPIELPSPPTPAEPVAVPPPTLEGPKRTASAPGETEAPTRPGALVVKLVADGKPVEGALVRLVAADGSRQEATALEGTARFDRLPMGETAVRADAEGFAGAEDTVTVAPGDEATLELELTKGVAFDGTVVDAWDGRPVPDAAISVGAHGSVGGFVSMSSRAPYDRTRADAEGRFHVRGVPEGEVATVEAIAKGYAHGGTSVRVLSGAVTPLPVVVRLTRGGRIAGVVRDPAGKPVEGATVHAMPATSKELRKNPRVSSWSSDGGHSASIRATTGADGAYAIEGLPLDVEYVVVAEAEGHARSEQATGLLLHRNRLEAQADLALRRPATVVVRLTDLQGAPVTQAAIVMLGGPLDGHRLLQPDDGGAYRFEGVNVGTWTVSVDSPSSLPGSAELVAEAEKTAEVVVRLDPGATVEGTVVDEDARPVAGAHVEVASVAENPNVERFDFLIGGRGLRADAKGEFAIRGLPSVESYVQARRYADADQPEARTIVRPKLTPPASGLRLVTTRLGRVVLRLVKPDGEPYVGPIYVWTAQGERREGSGTRTEDGRVRFDSLRDGEYDLQVDVSGFAPVRRRVAARLRAVTDLGDVALDLGRTVAGRVTDLAGTPVAGASVSASGAEEVLTDATGAFALEHLPSGPVEVSAEADGFLEALERVSVGPALGPVTLRLARGALVRAVVKDAAGQPADDARLVAIRLGADGAPVPDGPREWDATDERGRADWRLPAGRWRIDWGVKKGDAYEEVALGEWTLAEASEHDLQLSLPAR